MLLCITIRLYSHLLFHMGWFLKANIVILVLYEAEIRSSLWLKKVGY
jgi:hypothetical protein